MSIAEDLKGRGSRRLGVGTATAAMVLAGSAGLTAAPAQADITARCNSYSGTGYTATHVGNGVCEVTFVYADAYSGGSYLQATYWWAVPAGPADFDVLLVGGGGGGAAGGYANPDFVASDSTNPHPENDKFFGGSGGGGGWVEVKSVLASTLSGQPVKIVVGNGGAGATLTTLPGSPGEKSQFADVNGPVSATTGNGWGGLALNTTTPASNKGGNSGFTDTASTDTTYSGGSGFSDSSYHGSTGWDYPGPGGAGAGTTSASVAGGGPGTVCVGAPVNINVSVFTSIQMDGGDGGNGYLPSLGLFAGSNTVYGGGGGGGMGKDSCGSKGGSGGGVAGGNGMSAAANGTSGLGGGGGGGGATRAWNNDSPPTFTYTQTAGSAGGAGVVKIRFLAIPGAPLSLTATPGDGTASVAFTAGTEGGSPITNYKYQVDGGVWTVLSPAAITSPVTIPGLTNGTQHSIKLRAVNSIGDGAESAAVTVTPVAPVVPDSGGGSSSGSGSTPAPTPTPTPTASTPATPDLGPELPGSNPNLPAGGVPLGRSVMLVNGQPTPVTVKPDAPKDATGLDVTGDGFTMRLVGRTVNDKPLGVTPDGALILEQDRTAYTEGTGFKPNSEVKLYVFSEPRYLGTVMTDANGSFRGSVPLPLDIQAGRHTLQTNGLAPNDAVRSLSLGVQVLAPVVKTAKVRTAKATVYFSALSPKLDAVDMKSLRALAAGRGKATTKIVAVGYVQPTATTSNDEGLSLERAKAVAAYLKSIGVKGVSVARGDGIAKETGAAGRKAVVTITYRK